MRESPKQAQDFSDSERARLSRIARDSEREEWLRERNKTRFERFKGWAAWITTAAAVKVVLWDQLKEVWGWLQSHVK